MSKSSARYSTHIWTKIGIEPAGMSARALLGLLAFEGVFRTTVLSLALLGAALVACPTAMSAGSMRRAIDSDQSLQAKAEYCMECHGPSARGFVGYYTMPRLAGQSPEYIQRQLQAFAVEVPSFSSNCRLFTRLVPVCVSVLPIISADSQ
jgi:mono/diheme cytochrome c family protein